MSFVLNLTPLATNNFKQAIVKSNVSEKLKTDQDGNPNNIYKNLTSILNRGPLICRAATVTLNHGINCLPFIVESKANHFQKK